jgi:hypothetical protein
MRYGNTIRSNVKRAFNMIGDLAQLVTLSSQANSGFNFATNAVTTTTTTTLVIKGFLIEKRKNPSDKLDATIQSSFLFNAEDLPNPAMYDTITTAANVVWKIVPPYKTDDFLITINVAREA